jgi:hypothetical protein
MYGSLKILIIEHKHDFPVVNVWCTVMRNITGSFSFEQTMVTCEKFLAMMKNTVLHHIVAGTIFQFVVHHLTSPIAFVPF